MTDDCRRTRSIAAELALGIAEGQQRAEALEHLATCASCRAEIDHLAATADSLLLTAPRAEPPAGFETTVLNQLERPGPAVTRPRRSRRRLVIGAAAAAGLVVFLIAVGIGIGRTTTDGTGSSVTTDEVASGSFADSSGSAVGHVQAWSGQPSWLFVTVPERDGAPALEAGAYRVECVYRNGYAYTAGTLTIDPADGAATWSTAVDHPLDDLDRVILVVADGTEVAATLDHPD